MSKFPLEDLSLPLPGFDPHSISFDPLHLFKDAPQLTLPESNANLILPYLHIDNLFDKLPSPQELPFANVYLKLSAGDDLISSSFLKNPLSSDGILSGNFGDAFGSLSNLLSSPDHLMRNGLFGGVEDIGGVVGHITNPVNTLFSSFGDIGSKIGGVLGSVGNFLGPIGGIVGGITGGAQEGIKGLLSSVASGFTFGGPIGAGVMGLAHLTGLDTLAGKAIGGLVDGVKHVGSAIGSSIVDGVKSVGSAIGHGLSAIGGGLKSLFGF